ncbi:LacI family DNA-binding transcriptional regulator [Nocardia terpenica]|uniref:Uncharacterized protein n=1 Tax=Nocardia terpenica TaxID=455432 RepID=A0A291RMB3_9NOCA|nr:LacI family DNA-binding transcriptional regulator [Nocardia terpenica]ATL68726.1 hypothetical protein CRH09_23605 [Nocardia terpenica]
MQGRPTLRDVADAAGVHAATASRTIGLVIPDLTNPMFPAGPARIVRFPPTLVVLTGGHA